MTASVGLFAGGENFAKKAALINLPRIAKDYQVHSSKEMESSQGSTAPEKKAGKLA